MTQPYSSFSTRATPQSQPVAGRPDVVPNNAGGYAFKVDQWQMLQRFLILGAEGGTYYVGEKELVAANATNVLACIKVDGKRVVDVTREVSIAGRAPKNDPAIFVLALCASLGDAETKKYALAAVPSICRIPTYLFHFVDYVQGQRGWGRGLRRAIASWYLNMPIEKLAYEVIKYQGRDKWTNRDLLCLSHPKASGDYNRLFKWIVTGKLEGYHVEDIEGVDPLEIVCTFDLAKTTDSVKTIVSMIETVGLPRECIPTQFLTEPSVWEALLERMPITAMIRNLPTMTRVGLAKPMSQATAKIISTLGNADILKRGRVHPLSVLVALCTYASGHSLKGSSEWQPVSQITDALNNAFYLAFGAVVPAGKRTMLALDVSGSMTWNTLAGMPITPREASAAMSMVTLRTEPMCMVMAFADKFMPINISASQRLDDVTKSIDRLPASGTDCALPMIYAMQQKLNIDTFVVYCVDQETEILATNGWKYYDKVVTGDEVYTLNHKTGVGEWQSVSAVNVFPKEEREMILIEGRGHSSLSTPNHRWPVQHRGNSSWGRRWKTTETLNQVDYIQCAAIDTGLPIVPVYKDAFVEIVAWAWTEGSWNKSGNLTLCQSLSANPDNCNRIRNCLVELYGSPCVDSMLHYRSIHKSLWVEDKPRENGMIYWRINQSGSEQFESILDRAEKTVSYKWLRSLTLQQLELFINISMRADGFQLKNRLYQSSKGRADAFAFACILAGKPISFNNVINRHHQGVEIGLLERHQFAPVQNAENKDERPFRIEHIKYTGIVWCPTTPNETWLARRNGTVYWTGNTDSETWFGDIHPFQALQMYRQKTGISARLVVVGMTSTNITIADPTDVGMIDVCGFDTAVPNLINDFSRGDV